MNEIQTTEAEAIEEIVSHAQKEASAGADENGLPYVLLNQNQRVQDIEALLPKPHRIKKTRTFIALESFCAYVEHFKNEATMINLSRNGGAVAIIDASDKDDPRWEQHTAVFAPTYSERWTLWDGQNKHGMTQKQFAEFVEDNLPDFIVPAGAEMLDIAKTLQAEQSAKFNSAIKGDNGDVALNYERTTVGKAGQRGEMSIPSQFDISIPILEGQPVQTVTARLRYALEEGKLTLTYDIFRRAALLEEVRRSIYATIKYSVEITPYLVA